MRSAVTVLVTGYGVAMLLLSLLVGRFGDANSLGMLLLFGPRWLLLFPYALLLPLSLLARKRAFTVSAAVIGLLITTFGVSRFEIPAPWREQGAGDVLRVVSYNTDGSADFAARLPTELANWNAQLVLLQDCRSASGEMLRSLASRGALYAYHDREFCIASRLPFTNLTRMSGSADEGQAIRFDVTWAGERVRVGVVHLPTPRTALFAARNGNPELLERSVRVRSGASRFVSRWVAEGHRGPLIVAGDFNLPVESRALREDWVGLRNAFSEAGIGFGHTMFAGRHRVRIDHVLVSETFGVRSARVLSGFPSEHQPVIVELSQR